MQLPRNLNGAAPQPSSGAFKEEFSNDAANSTQQRQQAAEPAVGEAPMDTQSPYQQVGFSAWRRTLQIYAFALTFAFRYWRLGKPGTYRAMPGGMSPENVSAKKAELAKWLREGLIRLGPTFIKIGQQFSTRVDVLSKEFIAELELLQDKVCFHKPQ
jgi:predicted unusual protein kinase regulating ubiquinone biosynthesis (AarF/ABC1/UbiB family)